MFTDWFKLSLLCRGTTLTIQTPVLDQTTRKTRWKNVETEALPMPLRPIRRSGLGKPSDSSLPRVCTTFSSDWTDDVLATNMVYNLILKLARSLIPGCLLPFILSIDR